MPRRIRPLLAILLLLILSAGCTRETDEPTVRLAGRTMGTTWSVILLAGQDSVDAADLESRLQARLDQINRRMSTYDPESEISRFNSRAGTDWFAVSDETAQVVALSLEISRLTDGAFDISVGPLVELWGFGATQRGAALPTDKQVQERLNLVGYEKISLRQSPAAIRKQVPGLHIDLSAIAKGYAVDALAALLGAQGFDDFLLEIGGELRASGRRADGTPWRIAIEKPLDDRREVAEIFNLSDVSVATSGNYRNYYEVDGQRYSHTLDPVSGRPARSRTASATVLDPSCARADALATALMVMEPGKARQISEDHRLAVYLQSHEQQALADYVSPAFREFVVRYGE